MSDLAVKCTCDGRVQRTREAHRLNREREIIQMRERHHRLRRAG